jgi:hypothetical protein
MKICTKCKLEKEESEFYSDKRNVNMGGLRAVCKKCTNQYQTEYQKEEKSREYQKLYGTVEGRKLLCQRSIARKRYYDSIEYRELKRVHDNEYKREYQRIGNGRGYQKRYYHDNIQYRLSCILRKRLYFALKNDIKVGSAVRDLGCTIQELKKYLEERFQLGMSWSNYGEWHIDHKYPLSKVDLTDREQLLKVCHYTNLQPLWAGENIKKGNKLVD